MLSNVSYLSNACRLPHCANQCTFPGNWRYSVTRPIYINKNIYLYHYRFHYGLVTPLQEHPSKSMIPVLKIFADDAGVSPPPLNPFWACTEVAPGDWTVKVYPRPLKGYEGWQSAKPLRIRSGQRWRWKQQSIEGRADVFSNGEKVGLKRCAARETRYDPTESPCAEGQPGMDTHMAEPIGLLRHAGRYQRIIVELVWAVFLSAHHASAAHGNS